MKIEPVGVNRDRQIAELRGESKVWWCIGCGFTVEPNEVDHNELHDAIYCGEPVTESRPYSTDISAAMELWTEMRYEYAEIEITHLRVDKEWLIRPFKEDEDVIDDDFAFEVRESTLQGAISGVWLKYKGGDNG